MLSGAPSHATRVRAQARVLGIVFGADAASIIL